MFCIFRLPGWLLAEPGLVLRSSNPQYQARVESWYSHLFTLLRPLLWPAGGPVALIQARALAWAGNVTQWVAGGERVRQLGWADWLLRPGLPRLAGQPHRLPRAGHAPLHHGRRRSRPCQVWQGSLHIIGPGLTTFCLM